MLTDAVETYLAIRRAGGFKLRDDELYLNSFARFATARGDTHVVTQTAIAWARHGLGQMTVHKYGKNFSHTLHMAFKANKTRAEAPNSINNSCSGRLAIRRP